MTRLRALRLLLALAGALFAAGCTVNHYSDPGYDPAFPTMESVRDPETVGNQRPELLWQTVTGEPIWSIPVVAGDLVYVHETEQVYARNSANGDIRWRYESDVWLSDNLAVADGVVYVGSMDGPLLALDAVSGELLWRYETGSWVYGPAVADGVVYIATADDHVYALDGSNGNLIWRVHPRPLDSATVVANGVVYVGGFVNDLYALNAASGELLWESLESDTASSFPSKAGNSVAAAGLFTWEAPELSLDFLESDDGVVFASRQVMSEDPDVPYSFLNVVDGVVYFAARYDGIYAFHSTTGKLLWHFDDGEFGYLAGVDAAPAVVDGMMYAGAYNRNYNNGVEGSVIALDAASGEQHWHYRTAGAQFYAPVVAGGVVYATAYDGHLYAFDASSGDLFWNYSPGWSMPLAPAIVDGVIYLATSHGLLALRSVAGE